MLADFTIRALLAGIGVALAAAPLGCFVVWRRMAYFGDATAHAAIMGVAGAAILSLPPVAGALAVAVGMAVTVAILSGRGLAVDTLLGVLSHGALAAGLVAISLPITGRLDPMGFLFGDILAVGRGDLAVIWCGALGIAAVTAARWSALLLTTVNPDLARAEGVDPDNEMLVLAIGLAVVVAVAMQVVGVLLVAAMLIVPAAAARRFSRSPEMMVAIAAAIGVASVVGGLVLSLAADAPAGPAIVCAAVAIFAAVQALGSRR